MLHKIALQVVFDVLSSMVLQHMSCNLQHCFGPQRFCVSVAVLLQDDVLRTIRLYVQCKRDLLAEA